MKMEYAATLPKALDMARKWTGSEEVTVIPNGISVYFARPYPDRKYEI